MIIKAPTSTLHYILYPYSIEDTSPWLTDRFRQSPDSGIIEACTGDCCSVCHEGRCRLQSQMVYVWVRGYLILPDGSSLADSLSWATLHSNIIPAKLLKVFPVEQAKSRRDRITFKSQKTFGEKEKPKQKIIFRPLSLTGRSAHQ